jgi:hypothetical protein
MRKYVEAILLTTVVVFGSIIGGEALQQPYGDTNRDIAVVAQQVPEPVIFSDVEVIAENDVLEVGELGRLEASGEKADWSCVPDSADGQSYGPGNLSYCISFREVGQYTVVAAILADGEVHVVKYTLQVEGPVTVIVDPPVVDPPVVDPPTDIIQADPELVAKVQAAALRSHASKTRTGDVGEVFATVAEEIRSGDLSGSTNVINRTAVLNRELNVSGLGKLMGSLNVIIMQQDESGKLDDDEGCLEVWLSIAEGLNNYAS